ncbi:hypothetical protein AMR72_07880 [Flavobacterium psychrophilum]|nr:hypothetical protein AMR72_07880 [Flavobacterium psychrophilum]AOE52432.1 hypothetical protein ALW18_07870 [Flavobacterium psychrophilum]
MRQFLKITSIATVTIVILIIILLKTYFSNSEYYNEKYSKTRKNTPLSQLVDNWGKPDEEFYHRSPNEVIIYKYRKDLLGWDVYIFAFNPKDSLLISKHIDD